MAGRCCQISLSSSCPCSVVNAIVLSPDSLCLYHHGVRDDALVGEVVERVDRALDGVCVWYLEVQAQLMTSHLVAVSIGSPCRFTMNMVIER